MMMKMTTAGTIGVLASAMLLASCEIQDQRTPERDTAPPRTVEPAPFPDRELTPPRDTAPAPAGEDQRIRSELQYQIQQDQQLSQQAHQITIQVNQGVVTLSGQVQTQDEMNRILDLAWEVDGVTNVNNELVVMQHDQLDPL